jgi:hypothetical protein
MGTPAVIAIKDGEHVTWSSVNYDGYIGHTGRMLVEHYNDAERAKALIALGDLSVLDKSIECPEGHSFNKKVPGYTVAYGRDRGETGTEPLTTKSWLMFLIANKNITRYVFEGDTWYSVRQKDTKLSLSIVDRYEMVRVGEILAGTVE